MVQPKGYSFYDFLYSSLLIESLQEGLFVVLAQGDILAIVEEDATLGVACYALEVDDIRAVNTHKAILWQRGLHIL